MCTEEDSNNRTSTTYQHTYQPLELVCVDYLTLEQSKVGIQNILVITDHFTKFAQAIPTKNQTARTTAEALFKNFVVHYGIPSVLHSDQGTQFESNIIQELCKLLNIKKTRTTPYHPMGNGIKERFNRTLIKMLGTLENNQKADWKSHIPSLVHAYNCMPQETTGHSPYYLMFGREPKLPVDIAFGLENGKQTSKTRYIEDMKERLQKSYQLALKSAQRAKDRQKQHYDFKTRGAKIEEGDRVLVKIVAFEGKHKIADNWEEDPYIVKRIPNPDIPVYTVRKENGQGKDRTLHRNLLLPIGHLESFRPTPTPRKSQQHASSSQQDQKQRPTTRSSSNRGKVFDDIDHREDSDSDEDEAVEIVPAHNPPDTVKSDTAHAATDTEENVVVDGAGDDQLSVTTTPSSEQSEDAHTPQGDGGSDLEDDTEHSQSDIVVDHTDHTAAMEDPAGHASDGVHEDDDVDEADDDIDDDVDEQHTATRKSSRVSK